MKLRRRQLRLFLGKQRALRQEETEGRGDGGRQGWKAVKKRRGEDRERLEEVQVSLPARDQVDFDAGQIRHVDWAGCLSWQVAFSSSTGNILTQIVIHYQNWQRHAEWQG